MMVMMLMVMVMAVVMVLPGDGDDAYGESVFGCLPQLVVMGPIFNCTKPVLLLPDGLSSKSIEFLFLHELFRLFLHLPEE